MDLQHVLPHSMTVTEQLENLSMEVYVTAVNPEWASCKQEYKTRQTPYRQEYGEEKKQLRIIFSPVSLLQKKPEIISLSGEKQTCSFSNLEFSFPIFIRM